MTEAQAELFLKRMELSTQQAELMLKRMEALLNYAESITQEVQVSNNMRLLQSGKR